MPAIASPKRLGAILSLSFIPFAVTAFAQDAPMTAEVKWEKVLRVSKTSTTLQVVENPMVRPSSTIHSATFKALKDLGADYVRYVPWFPYPKMAVAELKPPTRTETFWDFTYLDSTMAALMKATEGHPTVINFSTTPAWMWKTDAPVSYPDNAFEVSWTYNQGTALRDTTMKEVADYYERLFSWYAKGGFTDEVGKYHASGHHYTIAWWEVLNEPDLEHDFTPQAYTKLYDAVVSRIHKISPATKFVGISVAFEGNPEWFEYFLDPKHHAKGIPLDAISYHNYPTPSWGGMKLEQYQYTFFEKANFFLEKVRYIENIRKRLSPNTITMINELGTIIGARTGDDIEDPYWNMSGAVYAHMFTECTRIGIDVAGMSQLVGYPTQFPDVSMMDWRSAKPNARYWVLRMIHGNFAAGDKMVWSQIREVGDPGPSDPTVQGFITPKGKKILIVNRKNNSFQLKLPADCKGASIETVDVTTGEAPASVFTVNGDIIEVKSFAVMVVSLK
jgi:hypothetical protein